MRVAVITLTLALVVIGKKYLAEVEDSGQFGQHQGLTRGNLEKVLNLEKFMILRTII